MNTFRINKLRDMDQGGIGFGIFFAFAFLVVLGGFGLNIYANTQTGTITTTVNHTERECKSTGTGNNMSINCRYIVYTTDGVFENSDSVIDGKFNSSDVQNTLEQSKGKQVTFDTRGLRFPIFSNYPNIVRVK